MNKRSREHHYLPQSYQINFARNPKNPVLWIYDKYGGEPRPQYPKTTGIIRDLYTVEDDNGKPSDFIEKELMAPIDGAASSVLHRIINEDSAITAADVNILSQYMALMHVRTPRQMGIMNEIAVEVLLRNVRSIGGDVNKFNEMMAAFQKDNPDMPEIKRDEFLRMGQDYEINTDREWQMVQSIQQADIVREQILQMKCTIVTSVDDKEFITCDSPMVVYEQCSNGKAMFGGGLSRPGVQVSFPIGRKKCLLLSGVGDITVGVDELNRRSAFMADRYIIASTLSERVRTLVNEARITVGKKKVDPNEFS